MTTVSVVIPVLNEEPTIARCISRLQHQSRPPDEIIVADGGSVDRTRAIVGSIGGDVRLVENPRRLQSAGLNVALKCAVGDVVVRLDGRSFVEPDYLERCVQVLVSQDVAAVGGRMAAVPRPGPIAAGIALANGAAWGAGPARFHRGGDPGPAETVYLGAFDRSWLERVGGWAEDVGVNEDYELNHRIRQAGGVVWYDPSITVEYEPRATFGSLARQYFRYGRSKATVMTRHPSSVRTRQVAPLLLLGAGVAAPSQGRVGILARVALLVYLAGLGIAAGRRRAPVRVRLAALVSAVVMHWSWSIGVAYGLARPFQPAGASDGR